MPLLFFILLIVLIAQIGFWKTLGAIIGAAAMVVVLILLLIGAVAIGVMLLTGRMRRS